MYSNHPQIIVMTDYGYCLVLKPSSFKWLKSFRIVRKSKVLNIQTSIHVFLHTGNCKTYALQEEVICNSVPARMLCLSYWFLECKMLCCLVPLRISYWVFCWAIGYKCAIFWGGFHPSLKLPVTHRPRHRQGKSLAVCRILS